MIAFRRLLLFLLIVSMIMPGINLNRTIDAQAAPTINIGSYIQFGMYNSAPILWRVIHKDANGDPVLFADRILTIKAFDAAGSVHIPYTDREFSGSNYYPNSNIRQWLNSSTNTINWIQNDPSSLNTVNAYNPYNTEKGFLADGNFTSTERGLIKPLTHKVLLSFVDRLKKDGGTANHTYNTTLSTVVQNYDTTAYFKNVTDNVFLLSVKQLKEWVFDNSTTLGSNYHIAKPTSQAVTQSKYPNTNFDSNYNWLYWLNSPYAEYSQYVRIVGLQGGVGNDRANDGASGVRPALLLNLSSAIFASGGTGTSSNPYVVSGGISGTADTQAPSAPSALGASSVSATSLTLAWTASTDNVGVMAYDVYRGATLIGTVSGSGGGVPSTSYNVTGLTAGTTYSFTVRAKDTAGNTSAASTALSVTTKSAPTNITLSASSIAENSVANTVVGSLSATDVDAGDTFTYTLVSGTGSTDNASFNISGNSLRTSASFDFETKSSYAVRIRVTDSAGLTFDKAFTISVTNVNDPPSNITLSNSSIAENSAANSTVGRLTATDQDAGTTFTYSLVSGTGSTDNANFNISGNTLRATNPLDFETKASHSIRVLVSDGSLTFAKAFTISVTNVNEAPSDVTLSANTLAENNAVNATVGTLSATDPDAGSTFAYSLVAGVGDTDNVRFNLSGNVLRATQSLNFEEKSAYSVRVQVSDGSLMYAKVITVNVTDVAETVTVNFDGQSGAVSTSSLSKLVGATYGVSSNGSTAALLPVPTRTHHSFVGWYTAPGGAGTLISNTSKVLNHATHTLYAFWNINSYHVTFNGNGQSSGEAPSAIAQNYNTTVAMPSAGTLTRIGHTFNGWNTAADGAGTAYAVGATFTFTADTTLYAQWTANNYTLTYSGNGNTGGNPPNAVQSAYNTAVNVAVAGTLTKTGATFAGWNTAANGSGTFYAAGASLTVTDNLTLYAQWTLAASDTLPPTVPGGLAANNITQNSLTLSWNASTDNVGVTVYEVYRGSALLNGNVTGTSLAVTGLTANTAYRFTVRAKDAAGNKSASSAALPVTTLAVALSDTVAPSVPSGFAVSGKTATGFTVAWKASTDTGGSGLDGYEVYLGDSSEPLTTVTTPKHTFTGLTPNTSYTVRVLAFDKAGNKSAHSTAYIVATIADTVAPSVPTGLTHYVIGPTSFKLAWNASTDNVGVTGYEVFRNGVSVGKTADTELEVTGLTENVIYNMTVRAYDAANRISALSAVYQAMTYLDRTAPTVPAGLVASNLTSKGFTLGWEPSTDDRIVAGYEVYLQSGEDAPELLGKTVEETFDVTDLVPGETYFVSVLAFDAAGPQANKSTASDPLEVTTQTDSGAPTVPDDLQAHTILGTSFVLTWEASTDDVGLDYYEIYKDGVLLRTNHKALSLIIDELTMNTAYSMTVKAVDKSGTKSDASEPLVVTTSDSSQAGPALSIIKLNAVADKTALLRYSLGSDAFMVVRILNSSNRSVGTFVNNIRTLDGVRTVIMPTARIKGGKYYVQLIARDPVTGNRSIVYKNITVDHTAPTVSSTAASTISDPGASSNITFTLSERAYVTIIAYNGKIPIRTIARRVLLNSGPNTVQWNGRDRRNRVLADGMYRIEVMATDLVGLESKVRSANVTIERALPIISSVSATPTPFKATGARTSISSIRYALSERANVTVKIFNGETEVVTLINNSSRTPGANSVTWNGRNAAGVLVDAGTYTYRINAVDGASKSAVEVSGNITLTR